MKLNRLGDSGLLIGDLTLGTMTFGDTASAKDAETMIAMFADAGGNHIDTANVYAEGRSEQIVGKIIAKRRTQFIVATKVRFPRGDGSNESGLSRRHILMEVEASLKRMKTDYVDLLYLHGWDPLTPLPETLRACDDLITFGKARYLGVSNFSAWHIMKALHYCEINGWHRFIAAQYQYSLLIRDIEYEFIGLCQNEGIGLMPWSPLGGGFLSGKYKPGDAPKHGRIGRTGEETEEHWSRRSTEKNWRILSTVAEIATKHKATHAQVALAWLRPRPTVSSTIIGANTTEQLKDNLAAIHLDLDEEDMRKLDEVSSLGEMYPYRFQEIYCNRTIQKPLD